MKIEITHDENGKLSSINAVSESQDGHLTAEESKALTDYLKMELEEETKQVIALAKEKTEQFIAKEKENTEHHKAWSQTAGVVFKGLCISIVDYLNKQETKREENENENIDFSQSNNYTAKFN